MAPQTRALAVHDISCFGRCSLTVALPILSAAGIETSVIPTAVLSTHTGGFTGFTYRDLTDDINPILEHWKTENIGFNAMYSGFLGSFEQIDIVCDMIDSLKPNGTKIFVDPVMADNGELYSIFGKDFPAGMRKVCSRADVIIPNITEAVFMLGEEYVEGPYTKEYIEGLLQRIGEIGANVVVLTGVTFEEGKLGAAVYDVESGKIEYSFADRIEGYFHGTGDVFGSALIGAMLRGKSLGESVKIAVDFTVGSIQRTFDAKTDIRFGVNFEEGLADYSNILKN